MRNRARRQGKRGLTRAMRKGAKLLDKRDEERIIKYRAEGGKPIFVRTIHIIPQTGQSFKDVKEYYDLGMAKTIAAILRKDKWVESCRVIRGEAA